jgi:hypothetical protein
LKHVEIDVPSAISFIKKLGHEKVYLIGHRFVLNLKKPLSLIVHFYASMGGGISCAYAGRSPEDIAGIVHLAGLYHYSLPYVDDLFKVYKSTCPKILQNILEMGAGLALRSAISLIGPSMSAALNLFSLPVVRPAMSSHRRPLNTRTANLEVAPPSSSFNTVLTHTSALLTRLRRQPIPVRTVVDLMLLARNLIPGPVDRVLLNYMYPSPWLPYSVEDPWHLIAESVESPSIGITLSISKMAMQV